MASVRDFHLVKEDDAKRPSFSHKIIRHRLGLILKVLVTAAVAVLLIVVLVSQYKNQIYTEISVLDSFEKNSLESNSYLNVNGGVITYSKDGISLTNEDGKVLWNMTYEMQSPIVHQAEGIVAVSDYNGHMVYVINNSGKVTEIDTNLPIRDFCVSKEGRVAAILEEANTSWIYLYAEGGEQLVEIKATMSKTGYPLSVTLSGEVMGVSYFYVDSNTMKSSVTFYNFGGIGENSSDHIVSSYDYADAVVPMIDFIDSETVVAVADNRLMFYGGSKKPISTSDTLINDNIVGVYYGEGNVGLVFHDSTGEYKYRLDMYNTAGKLDYSYSFSNDFKDIIVNNRQTMIYNELECIVLNDKGKEKFRGQFPYKVIFVSSTDSNRRYITVTGDSIDKISFE